MIHARIENGRIEPFDPVPDDWEGMNVVVALASPEPLSDLDERLASLRALGPNEYAPGEREVIVRELSKLDEQSRDNFLPLTLPDE